MKIISTAPVRIDFNGGGTDVNPYACKYGGAVVNATVNHGYCAELIPRDDLKIHIVDKEERVFDLTKNFIYGKDSYFDIARAILNYFKREIKTGFNLRIYSDIQNSTGLGSSASFAVALIGAVAEFLNKTLSKDAIGRLAFDLETKELGLIGGKQDQWCAAYGGVNLMEFGPGEKVLVRPIKISSSTYQKFQDWLIVFYTGGKRNSSDFQKHLKKNMEQKDKLKAFQKMKELAYETKDCLGRGNIEELGYLIDIGWHEKKRSNPIITNEKIDRLYSSAREHGAIGGQLAGAGQVGYLFFICPPQRQPEVQTSLEKQGAEAVNFKFSNEGLKVWTE